MKAGERVFVTVWDRNVAMPHGPYGTLLGKSQETPDFLEVLTKDSQDKPVVYPFVHRDYVWPA